MDLFARTATVTAMTGTQRFVEPTILHEHIIQVRRSCQALIQAADEEMQKSDSNDMNDLPAIEDRTSAFQRQAASSISSDSS